MSNPFEALTPAECRARLEPPAALTAALAVGARLAQIRGACGMGKTACLHTIGEWLAGRGLASVYYYVAAGEPLVAPGDRRWLLLDEAQRLPGPSLRRLAAGTLTGGGGLVLASHADRRAALRGLGPVTDHLLHGVANDAEVRALVMVHGSLPLDAAAVTRLRRASGGSREVLVRLAYELVEDQPDGALVTPADVDRALARLRRDAPEVLRWRLRHWREKLGLGHPTTRR